MHGMMQAGPLTLDVIFRRAETLWPSKQLLTATPSGVEWGAYGPWAQRTRRLGTVLDELGVSADGRVATFGWNTARHLELYFAAPCTGRVLHTLNIRLFADQLTYIANHAEDEVIFCDRSRCRRARVLRHHHPARRISRPELELRLHASHDSAARRCCRDRRYRGNRPCYPVRAQPQSCVDRAVSSRPYVHPAGICDGRELRPDTR